MWFILDTIIVLIVLFFAFLSAKKGFVRTLIEVVGFVFAIIIALNISTPISNFVYDIAVEPIVVETVEVSANDGTDAAVDAVWNDMPTFLTESKFFNISKDDISTEIKNENADNTQKLAESISEAFVKEPVVKLLSIFISIILVIVLLFVVKILAKYINKIFTFSVAGKLNKVLGAILGIAKGIAIAKIFCMVISLLLSFSKDGFLIFTYDAINSSYLFKLLMELTPFV